MQAHDGPVLDERADGHRALLGVRAEQPAHEEVVVADVRLAALDDDAEQQPAAEERALGRRQGLERVAQDLQRRPPVELADDVALGGGDGELRSDRRGALRDAGQHLDPVEAQAHGAAA